MREAIFGFLHIDHWGEFAWVMIGLTGQLMFTARFLLQWIASEKVKKSVMPVTFWYFSVAGGMILLAYALYRKDPVFVLGQSMGLAIYARNLWLIHGEKRAD